MARPGGVGARVIAHLRASTRPGFHRDDIDSSALLVLWSAEQQGPTGALADRLH